jgi:hypothetical protein
LPERDQTFAIIVMLALMALIFAGVLLLGMARKFVERGSQPIASLVGQGPWAFADQKSVRDLGMGVVGHGGMGYGDNNGLRIYTYATANITNL